MTGENADGLTEKEQKMAAGENSTGGDAGGTGGGESGGQGNQQEQFTPPATQEEFDKIIQKRLDRALKPYQGVNLDELKTKAQRLAEIEQGDMTEAQKEKARADTLNETNGTLAMENARLKAGIQYRNLTVEDLETLSGTPEQILAAAKRWSERLDPQVTNFDGGNRGGNAPKGKDMNSLIRQAAGFGG